MFTIWMWVGFILGNLITDSFIGCTFLGIVGAWIGAWLGAAFSDSYDDNWLINKREVIRLTLVFVFAAIVRAIADSIFDNKHIVLIIHIAAIVIFDSWKRICKGSIAWKQIIAIGGGLLAGVYASYFFRLPSLLAFVAPAGGAILGNWIYNKFFHKEDANVIQELVAHVTVYGKLAALDGGLTEDERDFFASRFIIDPPQSDDDKNCNEVFTDIFNKANESSADLNVYLAEFARLVILNQDNENIIDYFADLCIFAMLRDNGKLSDAKLSALRFLGEEFDIHSVFVDRIIADLKSYFSTSGTGTQTSTNNVSIEEYFAILGCNINDSFEVVKNAYRLKCKLNHPDKVQTLGEEAVKEATRKIQIINEAYEKIKAYKNW